MPILLIGIGIILIILNLKVIKDDKKNDSSFDEILREKESNISNVEVKLMELRKDMAETILELQMDMHEIKELIKVDEYKDIKVKPKNVKAIDCDITTKKINDDKRDKVRALLENGLNDDDDICKKLNIGKGELLLIKKLL